MRTYNIRFNKNRKCVYANSEKTYEVNDKVIVETDKGKFLAIIDSEAMYNENVVNIIIEIANEKQYSKYLKNLLDAKSALQLAQKKANEYKLDMKFTSAEFSLDKKQLFLDFISDNRIDFRDLVKDIANILHVRIELKQIGIRDKAKNIGGIGQCGRELCCKNFLTTINSVNIGMVKNQNISLNPTKINGLCGRLMCCFNYENDVYNDYREILPMVGDKIIINDEEVEVISLDILNLKYKIKNKNGNIEEVDLNDTKK